MKEGCERKTRGKNEVSQKVWFEVPRDDIIAGRNEEGNSTERRGKGNKERVGFSSL